ncbi:NfeD family protein [Dickeya lacustris]|uniref:NfeD family protein n=1 Tax=Dickeya lacustris TaxID=2259638 RepID=A0ABY8G626_9GAMM|nr:NfeD family protein [Dickeya lacustris]WFN55359.1 NfeD family protein [Dickeya lacustris]
MAWLALENGYGYWLSLGGLLLAAEMLGASGYLLWSGIAALLTGVITWCLPLNATWQCLLFATLTVAAALCWWLWLRQRSGIHTGPLLNQRTQLLIGQHGVVTEAINNGIGRVSIADSTWRAESNDALAVGTQVEIIAVIGITLQVRPLRATK